MAETVLGQYVAKPSKQVQLATLYVHCTEICTRQRETLIQLWATHVCLSNGVQFPKLHQHNQTQVCSGSSAQEFLPKQPVINRMFLQLSVFSAYIFCEKRELLVLFCLSFQRTPLTTAYFSALLKIRCMLVGWVFYKNQLFGVDIALYALLHILSIWLRLLRKWTRGRAFGASSGSIVEMA